MTQVVQARALRIGNEEVLVETVTMAGSEPTGRAARARDEVLDAFQQARAAILQVALETVDAVRGTAAQAVRPSTVEVEFGLKFSAQGNVIVAGASGEATLVVRLSYDAARIADGATGGDGA
ncbi:MAG: hypothetical protein M3320_06735 [Actinomycetota bacterium]|nr:hypothetical protein [Actinomycetota bacterium]MDQ5808356.1 hypothetical protein [Actinomycetota bacterium]